MKLEDIKPKLLKELVGQQLTAVVNTFDGYILMFNDQCCHLTTEEGYENDCYIEQNKDFNVLDHAGFFSQAGVITEEQSEQYQKQRMQIADEEFRARELAQLERLKLKYENKP